MVRVGFQIAADMITVDFPDEDQYVRFQGQMMGIKYAIADINEDFFCDKIDSAARDQRYLVWLASCQEFRRQWGDRMVFPDIRLGWNSVEENMGLPMSKFPMINSPSEPGLERGFTFISISQLPSVDTKKTKTGAKVNNKKTK